MTYNGRVQDGVVILDEGETPPPEGATVRVEVVDKTTKQPLKDRFKSVIGKAEGLPPDAASRVDDYLYGATDE